MEGNEPIHDGICLTCAKELGIKPVDDLLQKFGLTDDDMEQMDQQLSALMNPEDGNEAEGEEGFMPGGAATFPFLQNLFGRHCRPLHPTPEPFPMPRHREKKRKQKRKSANISTPTAPT